MTKLFVKPGKTMTITAGADIASGDGVQVAKAFGIAQGDIASGDTGEIGLVGVYRLPKTAPLVIAVGVAVYWDPTPGEVNVTSAAQEKIGICNKAALSADTEVEVRLDGIGTVTGV